MGKKQLSILASVHDKSGLADFMRSLSNTFQLRIASTGGTANHLEANGFEVVRVEECTQFPELLGGRVKTLHPVIFAGILADRDNPNHTSELAIHHITPIDMVVVNLYPFRDTINHPGVTLAEAIEQIDIGGVALLRAAAKNFTSTTVISSPSQYKRVKAQITEVGGLTIEDKLTYAKEAFELTSSYDALILKYLAELSI